MYQLLHDSYNIPPPAPRPKPFEADKAYFSEVPKLITIPKGGKPLGFSIMTREVSNGEWYRQSILCIISTIVNM